VHRRFSLGLLGCMATASGAYLLIYLVRWEWHRALIAGLFFVAAEVALVAGLVLSRMRGIERRLDQLAAPPIEPPAEILGRLQETAPPPRPTFAWLKGDGDLNVFLPVLLGAGLLVSAAAWGVESLARATARPVLERDLARRLVPATWPSGGLLGEAASPVPSRRRRPRWLPGVAVLLALGSGVWVYNLLADAIQTRPEEAQEGFRTEVELRFSGSRIGGDPARMAAEVWGSCKLSLRRSLPDPVITPLDSRRANLTVPADLGRHAATRMRGCFQDAAIDHLQARVVSVNRTEGG